MGRLTREEVMGGFLVEVCPPDGGRTSADGARDLEMKMREALRLIRINRYFSGAQEILSELSGGCAGLRLDLDRAADRESLVPLLVPEALPGADPKVAKRAVSRMSKALSTLRGSIGSSKDIHWDVCSSLRPSQVSVELRRRPLLDAAALGEVRATALGEWGPLIRAENERLALEEVAVAAAPNARGSVSGL